MVELELAEVRLELNGRDADARLVGESDVIRFFQDADRLGDVEFCTERSSPLHAYLQQRAGLARKHPEVDSLSMVCETSSGDRWHFAGGIPLNVGPHGPRFGFHTIWAERAGADRRVAA